MLGASSLAWCERVGVHLSHLADCGRSALLVRPDYYVIGGAEGRTGTPCLVAALREGLTAPTAVLQP
ncbi:hypothetical protein GTY44_39800 [Streptomyces sp. SID5914]|nr:hypothetical protein [Streptomyces sp. SID5914]MZG19558.1 hypothetical protein [Streptomyces sp. SID5914]